MTWLLSTQAVMADAYEHLEWRTYGNLTKNDTEIQFDKARYELFKFPAEGFALKYAQPWTLSEDKGWLITFGTQVRGGMKIMPLPAKTTITLDKIVSRRIEAIRHRVQAEGGKLVLNSTPSMFCGFPGKKIEQKITFSDVKQPIICNTYISIGNNKAFLLDLAAPEYLYNNKIYCTMLSESASSAHEIAKGVRVTKLKISDGEIDSIVSDAISNLKELDDRTRKIVYKYPSNWEIRKPYVLAAGETVILFDSPKNLIHGAITCKEVFPGENLASIANDLAHPSQSSFGKRDIELMKNEPCTFSGHPGRQVVFRSGDHYDMTDPLGVSFSYLALANGKVYELNINAPEAAFPKVQKLIDVILPSIKF